jgi:hypothetical protein
MSVYVAIISAGRPDAPRQMAPLLDGVPAVWYVPMDEVMLYQEHADVVIPGGNLISARNLALDDAAVTGSDCLQLSDDLTKIEFLTEESTQTTTRGTVRDVVMAMEHALRESGAHLAGVAPTNNAFFAKIRTNPKGFCVGDMILVKHGTPLRFDPQLLLKEDYDYTAQHLARYGQVARLDWLMPTFKHGSNRGGAVAYRTPELEQETIAYLKAKWPDVIVDNPRRKNEVLFRWKGNSEAAQPTLG